METPIKKGRGRPRKEASFSKDIYTITLKVGSDVQILDTENLVEGMLSLKPEKITNQVTVTVKRGDKSITRGLMVQKAKRLFFNKIAMEFFCKNLNLMLK